MARRILNRKELRADFDAAEKRKEDTEEDIEDEEGDEDEEDDEEEDGGADAEDESDDDESEGGGDDEDEDRPKKKKKKAVKEKVVKPKAKPKAKRAPKVTRMKVVWGVFNNSNQRVAVYDYPKRKEADDHAAKLTSDKKSTHFVQPVKEPIEEKKEA